MIRHMCDLCGQWRDEDNLRKLALAWGSSFGDPRKVWNLSERDVCEGCASAVHSAIDDVLRKLRPPAVEEKR